MKLVVGLGNPGKEYENTRHNIGFIAIDYLVKKFNLQNSKKKFNSIYYELKTHNEKYFFIKPQTYMNLSGNAIISFATYLNIDINDIVVIYDDKDLELFDIKIKFNGSSAGHNGLNDIIKKFKTTNVPRIKIGIGFNENYLIKDWVLSNFNKQEQNKFPTLYKKLDMIFEPYLEGQNLKNIISKINLKKEV